ncbi:hypothetical protein [Nostoc sp.]|uniref:hypothetical protein n=1 Tax=Nostoc sp. TaxID=1180 RepID=UPI002FF59A19
MTSAVSKEPEHDDVIASITVVSGLTIRGSRAIANFSSDGVRVVARLNIND